MKKKIFLNSGHGHPDPGAVGRNGTKEAEVAWSVGLLVRKYLEAAGYDVMLVQSNALTRDVIQPANRWGADLFLSIHCNSVASPQAHGTETFCHPQSIRGEKMARMVQRQLIKEFGLADRGVKTSTKLGVLRDTDMPACLAELAFISNPNEEALLQEAYHDRWARALARGVSDYFA
jgi:N-acetylmuramoyl-L-alanine amidase